MATEPIPPRPDDDAVDDVVWTEASLREIDAAVRRHSLPRLQSAADHLDNSEAAAGARGINLAAAADGELGIPAGLDAQLQELDSGLIRTRAAFRHCRACFGLLRVTTHAESGSFVSCSNFAAASSCPYTRLVQEPGTPQELGCDAPADLRADALEQLADLWWRRRAVEAGFAAGGLTEWAQMAARCQPLQLLLGRGSADLQAVRRAAAALEFTAEVDASRRR